MFKSINSGCTGNSTFSPANIFVSISFKHFSIVAISFIIVCCSSVIGWSANNYLSVLFNNLFLKFLAL